MKTIAQQLNITEFPFTIKDKGGNEIYYEEIGGYWFKRKYDSHGKQLYFEDSDGTWFKKQYDSSGNEIYYENSKGTVIDNRPKPSCEGKVVEIDGKKYKLKELK